MVGQGGDEMS